MTGEAGFSERLRKQLSELQSQSRLRSRRTVTSISSTECLIDQRRCISFGTNDYLGLRHDSAVCRAFSQVAAEQTGSGASALIAGRTPWHEMLEAALTELEHAEATVLFPSGFAANIGTLNSLITPKDGVFCDRDNHASLVDGCRSSSGKMWVYDHSDLTRLEESVSRRRHECDQVFIVTDSVFSMDGTLASLGLLCDIADRHRAVVVVDEAHATGVFGIHGGGVCELQGVGHRIPVRIGTMSKALGCQGGFVSGSRELCDWMWNSARSQFFSTALPPAICAAVLESIRIVRTEPERRSRLLELCSFARQCIQEYGLTTIPDGEGPIIPIVLGSENAAMEVSARLQERGFFAPAIRPPTVAAGTSRLRLSLCADHSQTQIDDGLREIRSILDRL